MTKLSDTFTREEALELGIDRYSPGIPCVKGHLSSRYTKSKACIECHNIAMVAVSARRKEKALAKAELKAQQREASKGERDAAKKVRIALYRKEWRLKNIERIKAVDAVWIAANSARKEATTKAWRLRNPEKVRAYSKACVDRNPEKERLRHVRRYWKNVRACAEKNKKWRQNNQLKCRTYYHNYMSLKKQRGVLSRNIVQLLLNKQQGACPCCGKELGTDYHLDHVIPLSKGGTNTDDNVQLLRKRCNLQKSARMPEEFLRLRRLGIIQP